MRSTDRALAAVLALALAGSAAAQAVPAPRRPWLRWPEALEMLAALVTARPFEVGTGWFHRGEALYGWSWLSARFDADRDGRITAAEIGTTPHRLAALDRDRDGAIREGDLHWKVEDRLVPPDAVWLLEQVARLYAGELGWWVEGPGVGDPAPDFTLSPAEGGPAVTLSKEWAQRPVVLIFGSFT